MVLCKCVSRVACVVGLLTGVRLQVRGALDAAVIVAVAVFPFPKWALKRYDVGYVWATVFAASIRSAAFVLCSMYSQWLLFLDEEQRKVRVVCNFGQGFGGHQCVANVAGCWVAQGTHGGCTPSEAGDRGDSGNRWGA